MTTWPGDVFTLSELALLVAAYCYPKAAMLTDPWALSYLGQPM